MPRGRPPKKASEQDFPYGSIKKIVNHSLDPQSRLVTLTVSLTASKEHQISEWDAQEFRPELLQSYWDSFAGKTRQDVLGIGELYHPFRILRHRRVRGQWQVLVQWLGYSAAGEDVSWEPASKLRHDAPDVVVDYIKYVEDEGARAALLGPLAAPEAGKEEKGDKEKAKPAAEAVTTPAPVKSAKRKRESVVGEAEPVSDKRRRSSRYESTPTAAAAKTPATKPSAAKRRHSELPDAPAPQATPRSTRRQSKIPPPAEDVASTTTTTTATTTVVASSPARPQRRKSSRASSAALSASASTSEATTTRRLSPADVPRTMLWFMDDFTVGDMQKVCRFIDEHCSGKLRLPLYSGGNWDGKAASGRWEDVFMVSPLGRLGRYDDDEEEEKEE
ncbi:chromo domain-containing protein [Colletotrichum sojae]|uniref:Chromo domain-containing protein n=1 Tax=Colletotrichum sojae TaxID=2175907 RepID=A0A8H6IP85_9PEZI|nr:chromo domain-containing protein [Colletotrichum sojae]